MQTSPRRLTVALTLVLMAGAAIAAGCGSSPTSPSSPNSPPPATAAPGSIAGTVGENHALPHVAVITAAQLAAGDAVTLGLSNGLHSHTVSLSAAQVGQIAAGAQVAVVSSLSPHSDGSGTHQHTVTFN